MPNPQDVKFLRDRSRTVAPGDTWTGDPAMILAFRLGYRDCTVMYIRLGTQCESASTSRVGHWAHVEVLQEVEHDCSMDHISSWPDLSRRFGYKDSYTKLQVTLSFTRFELDPQHTLVLRLDVTKVDKFENDCVVYIQQKSLSIFDAFNNHNGLTVGRARGRCCQRWWRHKQRHGPHPAERRCR
ncbi:hypothetical protein C8Q74DRAFT_1305971 [Fomes fomentarius]|nr:hypothetical protein C8Q74DRAFT_1305971 [Fomes fomentarius]